MHIQDVAGWAPILLAWFKVRTESEISFLTEVIRWRSHARDRDKSLLPLQGSLYFRKLLQGAGKSDMGICRH